jgi:hypothetical protein
MSQDTGVLLAASRGDLAAVKRHLAHVGHVDECTDEVRRCTCDIGVSCWRQVGAYPPALRTTSCNPKHPPRGYLDLAVPADSQLRPQRPPHLYCRKLSLALPLHDPCPCGGGVVRWLVATAQPAAGAPGTTSTMRTHHMRCHHMGCVQVLPSHLNPLNGAWLP